MISLNHMKNLFKTLLFSLVIISSLFVVKHTFAAALITVDLSVDSIAVPPGNDVTLSWTASSFANSCVIKGNGVLLDNDLPIGTRKYNPMVATTYEVTCSGPGAVSGSDSVIVTMLLAQNITPSLSASPTTVAKGGSTTIRWSVNIANTICNINGDTNIKNNTDSRYYDLVGSKTYTNIQSDTTYTLTCSRTGFATKSTSVTVNVAADTSNTPVTVTASASPTQITQGEFTNLTWTSSPRADYCSVRDLPQTEWAGTKKYYPQVTTVYTVTCYKTGYLSGSKSVTVTVSGGQSGTSKADLTISEDRGTLSGTTINFHPTVSNGGGVGTESSFVNSYEMQVFTAPKLNGSYITTYNDPDGLYYEHSISSNTYTAPMTAISAGGSSTINNFPAYTFAPESANAYVAYRVKFCTDMNNSVSEDVKGNNCTNWSCWSPTSVITSGGGCGWGFRCSGNDYGNTGATVNLPNLKPSRPTHTPAEVSVGTPINFSASINNIGALTTGASFSNFFQVQKDLSSTIIDLPATSMSILGAGDSGIATATYTVPTTGTYYIRACADKSSNDSTGVITESDEDDNCSPWTTIMDLPSNSIDLTASIPIPRVAYAGYSKEFTSTITNTGSTPTGASFAVLFQTSTSKEGTNPTNYVVYPISSLAGGASVDIKKSLSFPTAGKYYVKACADNYGAITETNETNNCSSSWAEIIVTNMAVSKPDLSVTSITPTSVVVGNETEFSAIITNGGITSTEKAFYNKFQTSKSSSGLPVLNSYTTSLMNSLEGGVSSTAKQKITFGETGTYYIKVCADSSNIVSEIYETNNCSSSWVPITVMPKPLIQTTNPLTNNPNNTAGVGGGTIKETLRIGSTGAGVQTLQSFLGITADGKFGLITAAAVRRWQAFQDLVADGVFGPKSLTKSGLNN